MYSKQEKLAAARKKLKEFQGKQRDNDANRISNVSSPASDISTRVSSRKTSVESVPVYQNESNSANDKSLENPHTPVLEFHRFEKEDNVKCDPDQLFNSRNTPDVILPNFPITQDASNNSNLYTMSANNRGSSEFFSKDIKTDTSIQSQNAVNIISTDNSNDAFNNDTFSYNIKHCIPEDNNECNSSKVEVCKLFKDTEEVNVPEAANSHLSGDPKDFFGGNFKAINTSKESPSVEYQDWNMQMPSVSQLVEEKNNLLQVLKRTEELLKFKSDQEQTMTKSVSYLQSRVQDLEGSYMTALHEVQGLRVKNEELMRQRDIEFKMMEDLQEKFDSKEEKFSELQQKLEIKTKECDALTLRLNDVEMQLSASLIKIQQLTVGESASYNIKINDIQNENMKLICKIQDLEKNIEILKKEKEQSSQSFHIYAQQYNDQLNSLSEEVRSLVKKNQQLLEKNETLEKNVKELQNIKKELEAGGDQLEIIELSNKLSELSNENKILQKDFADKMVIIEVLEKEKNEKSQEINQVHNALQEVRSEYLKLLQEREAANGNHKLLAAMESDKVAAARAVSQNQKLKEQVVELEEGFIKLSHEKLQLTDELSHEKHLRKELEHRIKQLEDKHCEEHKHHNKTNDSTTNESADVEELRNIIRQLEGDKTELLSRLNSGKAKHLQHSNDRPGSRDGNSDNIQEDSQNASENSKLIMQQMEEKVKKTMNEIAALDEEKEKLEHLVLQLQGETETIGEYISLYQTQRMMLRQRNKEKDDQLMQLAKDKEELKSKLSMLNELVNHLLTEKGTECKEMTDISMAASNLNSEVPIETAVKIQTLISEIQSTNLIDNQSIAFEHCSCCSGRLITI